MIDYGYSGYKIRTDTILVNTQKESLLLKVRELVLKENDDIIGYSAKGEPFTVSSLNAKLNGQKKITEPAE